jgi:hypothetical protein
MTSNEIHIVSGFSAAGTLRQALRPAALLVSDDVLSCGPLPPLDSLDHWLWIRESYLRTLALDDPEISLTGDDDHLLADPSRLCAADSLLLWIGTTLNEQLLLVWIVQLLRLLGIEMERLRVILFTRDGFGDVVGVGMCRPDQLRAHPAPEPLTDAALAQIDRAWAAITAPEPSGLLAFLAEGAGPLPFLSRSLQCLLDYYPDATTGLNHWETTLLKLTDSRGSSAVRIVAYTMGDSMDSPDLIGDPYLLSRLRRLSNPSLAHPALVLSGTITEIRGTEARLTETGRELLSGKANFVDLSGIDDWVGGVHLDSACREVWFRQDRGLQMR